MNYSEAIELAKQGEERGFGFLYEMTYKSKYYLAIKYMKDEDMAQDVLQDSYIRAFGKLDQLSNPDAFPSWLGMIVANTAKNMLKKKNPMLFSDLATEDGEEFEYQIEDDNAAIQPETAYTRKETQELVHEFIDSLPDEQRMCILMFHIEGIPISRIAEIMNCSENTVKSRLNYGRKSIKNKAEDLKKKGYKLYGVSPLPLLLILFRSDEKAKCAEGVFVAAGRQIAKGVFSSPIVSGKSASGFTSSNQAVKMVTEGTSTATRMATGHAVIMKVVIGVVSVSLVGGASFYAVTKWNEHTQQETEITEQVAEENDNKEEENIPAVREETEEVDEKEELSFQKLVGEPVTYVLSSGAGAWSSELTVDADNSFTGSYSDVEQGSGTIYYSDFKGQFENIKQVDDNIYSMAINQINYKNQPGDSSVDENGMTHLSTIAYGLVDDTENPTGEIRLYLPGASLDGASNDFKLCLSNFPDIGSVVPEGYYLLQNVSMDQVFVGQR